jgi:DNA polymerase-1
VALVGPYAIGDVVRTRKLHEALWPSFDAGERAAYDRERRLMPILLRNEQEGMRLDLPALERDIEVYQKAMTDAERWLRKRLKSPGLDLDKKEDVARVLDREGIITDWTLTPKSGKKSTSKKYMTVDKFTDPKVASALGYRNRLQTVMSMSMLPWREQGKIISTSWNQVRQSHGEDNKKGTRTGRLSCARFQNITKDFEAKDDGYVHPKFLRVPSLPLVRRYVLPDTGGVFLHRDYSQQELRILAHFEDGPLLEAYTADPNLDVHTYVQKLIAETTGLALDRGPVKIMNFGKVYGMGIPGIIAKLRCTEVEARRFAAAHRAALPGLRSLEQDIKARVAAGEPIRTWGGRLYHVEEAKEINGILRNFDYKLVNYLIQGSAADCTKEALIRYDGLRRDSRFMVTVHDEINISAPKKALKQEMALLREAMESVEFDVPMLSDAKVGESWGDLKKWVE